MKGRLNLFGHQLTIAPANEVYQSNVTQDRIRNATEILNKYKRLKSNLEKRIIEEEQWWKMRHWEYLKGKKDENEPDPVTAYLFNTVANKHADAMDNYPEPNFLPREQDDEEEAERLSKIVPKILAENRFKRVYDDAWWYKVKHGFSIYGTFFNPKLSNGIGNIDVKNLDALNVFWDTKVRYIQDSRNLFIVAPMDDEELIQRYPWIEGKIKSNKVINVEQYIHDDSVDTSDMSLVVDWYYKMEVDGRTVVHMTKFVGDIVLESSEDNPETAVDGLYKHGQYPVDFDVLFPEEGTCYGFGYVAVVMSPQIYIDKLDQIISKNALMAGKKRFFVKDTGSINEQEFLDWSKDLIHVSGDLTDTHIREFQVSPLDPFIVNHRQNKINELKEISGANEFTRGESGGGITAASAIAMLQEAGSKLSRDMIQRSYECYTDICYKVVDLIGQFFDLPRNYRIDKPNGDVEYITYDNSGLQEQHLDPLYPGEDPKFRKPIFDINIKPQKASPYSRIAANEMAKELFAAGFFNPQRAPEALIALELMSFEGIEKVRQQISVNGDLYQQMLQMKQTMDKMALIIEKFTGRNMLGEGDMNGGSNIR